MAALTKRTSTGIGFAKEDEGGMRPPPSRRKKEDVGETY
jgi:hypothetical protein